MSKLSIYICLIVICALYQSNGAAGQQSTADFYSKCGNSVVATENILRGEQIELHKMRTFLPWLINLRTRSESNKVICGGSVIGPNLIMTAAHCVFNGKHLRQPSELWVYVNSYNISGETNPREVRIPVKKMHIHDRYKRSEYSFDVAILETTINMGVAAPLCLPCLAELQNSERIMLAPRQPNVNETCLIVGWGTTEDGGSSQVPMGAEVSILSNSECQKQWPNVNRAMLCTSQPKHDKGASCMVQGGDSGGPLYCYDRSSDRYLLQGVISWGSVSCAAKPSVYTNVAVLRRWIAQILKELGVPEICSATDSFAPEPCSQNDESCKPSKNPPKCDATQFKFANDHYVVGTLTTKTHYLHKTLTMAQCVDKCCEADDCQSALFYKESLECFLYTDKNCQPTNSVMAKEEKGVEYFAKECHRKRNQ